MDLPRNVGGIDRRLRAVVGTIAIVGAGFFYQAGQAGLAVLALILGVGLWLNVALCFCSINKLLGVDTTTK